VKAAGRSSPLCEIELELKSGRAAVLALAVALQRSHPVHAPAHADVGIDGKAWFRWRFLI